MNPAKAYEAIFQWQSLPLKSLQFDNSRGVVAIENPNTEDMALTADQLLMARTVYHIVVAATHLYTTAWFASFDFVGIQSSQKMVDLMRFADRYLTGWNFALQIAHLVMALYCDYAELKRDPALEEKLAKVKNIRDFLFTSLVFPGSMFVATMFWIVFTMDREMVLPKECDQFIPMWVNHITHTWIVPVVLLEVALQPRTRPNDETPHLLTLLGYHTLYTAVLLGTYFSTGRWIYPLYNSMTWVQRSILLTLIFYLSMAFYYVGWHTNDLIWRNAFAGDELQEENKTTSQDKSTVSNALAKSIVEINERGFAMYDEGF